jgi:general L-amino acid transport system permease protein
MTVASQRAIAWTRANLFGSVGNSALTLIGLVILYLVFWSAICWLLIDATFTGGVEACKANEHGACWPYIGHWWRFILFGRYPYEQQWRPGAAIALFAAMLGLSCVRALWWRRLMILWAATLVIFGWLIFGGLFGLDYVPTEEWGGLQLTVVISVSSLTLAFPLGVLLALCRRSNLPVLKALSVADIELIRGVPLISVLFMASVMIPLFLPPGTSVNKLLRAVIGFTLFEAAYMAETVRAGLQAIPRGQFEAADALGLSYWVKMRKIILPQALRLVIPPMVNILISTFKDTSLVLVIGLFDLLNAAKNSIADPLWRPYYIEAYVFAGAIYFAFCFFMSRYSQYIERDLRHGADR